ncbi:MAG: CvpA family protein [Sphingomonadales bacterium]
MELSGLDIAVGVILMLSAIIAFLRGFVTEVLSLAAWGGAIVLTMLLYGPLSSWVMTWITIEWLSKAVAIAFLFFFGLMFLRLITSKIGGMVRSSSLGIADRAIGAAFGVVRGFAVISFAFLIYTLLMQPKEPPTWVAEAQTGTSIMDGANLLAKVIYGGDGGESPSDILGRLKKRAQEIAVKNALNNTGYAPEDREGLDTLTKAANSGG